MVQIIENHFLVYFLLFLSMVIFSLLTNSLFLKFVRTLGMRKMDAETIIRWGPKSKPALGGFNFYIVFLLCITANSVFFDPNQFFLNKEFVGLLLCTTLAFIVGLTDDAYDTRPLLKLAGQITCGVILILTGNYISITGSLYFNYFLTIIWVVGIMNSINMLDNMDAITSVVSMCIMLCCLLVMATEYEYVGNIYFILLLGGVAALIGFLRFNWHPSKMYMGDTGSQFLGALLSAVSIIFLWNFRNNPAAPWDFLHFTRNLILVALAFIMTITDTSIVIINRIMNGHSPFVGGKDHTTHNLARLGLSDSSVALVFFGVSFLSVLIIWCILRFSGEWKIEHTFLFGGYFLAVLTTFFLLTRKAQHYEAKEE